MTTENRRRFTVITNTDFENNHSTVTTPTLKPINPYLEKFLKFSNEEAGRKFTVEDLLKW